jgi:hypothetical protein
MKVPPSPCASAIDGGSSQGQWVVTRGSTVLLIDDIIVYSSNKQQHMNALDDVCEFSVLVLTLL